MVSVFFRHIYMDCPFLPIQKIPRGKISADVSQKHPSVSPSDRFPDIPPVSKSRKRVQTLRTASRGLRRELGDISHALRAL
jgi:hypothetical protein